MVLLNGRWESCDDGSVTLTLVVSGERWVVVAGVVGTVVAREQRKAGGMSRDRRLAAHVVVVVALRRRRRHEGRRRRQARGPAPRAARERVHGGERAHVAHARGALAAGRLRPPRARRPRARPIVTTPALPDPGAARALRSPTALRVFPTARPRAALLCFEFLIYRHSSSSCSTYNKPQH